MGEFLLQYDEIEDSKVSKYFTRSAIIFIGLLPFVVFGFVIWLCSGSGSGSYNIISSISSPDGKNIAIVYSGSGGGAAGWTFLRATIISANEQFNPEQHTDYIFDVKGGSEVETIWQDNQNLLITYKYKPEKNNSYLRVSKEIYSRHTGVNIKFVEKGE